nr:PREDICTED: FK506-binding protein 15 isoform X2 [Anolis carolinensis]|eukprot:XP_008118109.1 PREDICTED: FK506-binding protein 15 isoform X2 [Anolis carolinensis]
MENPVLSIEPKYIKNLQQQIYFLEAEANFLREQTKKATVLQPHMASEMEHLLQKLQELQSRSDGLELELKRKESGLNVLKVEKEQLSNQIIMANENHSKEKLALVEEIIELKRRKEQKDRLLSVKEVEILHAKQELDEQQINLSNREQAILVLQTKVKQQSEKQKAMELQLSEKRKGCLKMQSAMHEMEDKIFKKTAEIQEHITHELRSEISFLHQQMHDRELLAEQDHFLRSKMVDDYHALTKENAILQSRLLDLIKQTEIERALKDEIYASHSASIAQLLTMKDHEKHLLQAIKRHQEFLEQQKSTFQDLEAKFTGKENSLLRASNKMLELDEAISALKTRHTFRLSLQSENWSDVSKMANSMKNLKTITS